MFQVYTSLTSLDALILCFNFNTENANSTQGIFGNFYSLNCLDVLKFKGEKNNSYNRYIPKLKLC